jgi:glyoxylase-like metal-dependent hydrolase (beta-lactamase superfamily II)
VTEIHLPDQGPTEPIELAPGWTIIPLKTPTLPPATRTCCLLLGTGDAVVVVDPGSPYAGEQQRLLDELTRRGKKVEAIWLTHHHGDHVGGAQALREATGAPVLAHPAAEAALGGSLRLDDHLYDGDAVELGELEIEVLHTPGHSRDHLCFCDRRAGLVAVGDLVAGQGTVVIDPPGGHMADYLASLARLIQRGVTTLVPAHGYPIERGEQRLLEYIAHRMQREEQVLVELAAGPAAPLDLAPAIYPEVPSFFWPLAARQVLAHLLKLQAEGKVAASGATFELK